ncbi:dihydrodipicolinate synthase family protein [Bremerella alba]|nr:dihydrodipicolinate synthase family protein [Bremerella alba]
MSETSDFNFPAPEPWVRESIRSGIAIPAHPLALTKNRKLDERRQRAITRYYHAAGAQGLAIGVHTTQFEIRQPQFGLYQPVLELAADTARNCDAASGSKTVLLAGICGDTKQAVAEARLARDLGYHIGMISLSSLSNATDEELVTHCRRIAAEIPIFGFYMQSAVGGRDLSPNFWRNLATVPNLVGVKIAPFDRYKTLEVIRAIAETGRSDKIALYTGNDDNIVLDLLTKYVIGEPQQTTQLRIVGGLLGHWACWTKCAVQLLQTCQATWDESTLSADLLTLAAQVTDCNAALFDARNKFDGCVVGIHYALEQQGLLDNLHLLDPKVGLSSGQRNEIDRVRSTYPQLVDDDFVKEHLDQWLS